MNALSRSMALRSAVWRAAYEADSEKRRDLMQEIHLALWRSFKGFDGRCSLRTWVYRVAHNAAVSWVILQKRTTANIVTLEELHAVPVPNEADRHMALERLTQLIQRLKPLDRQVILAWLEGMDAEAISELTGTVGRKRRDQGPSDQDSSSARFQ